MTKKEILEKNGWVDGLWSLQSNPETIRKELHAAMQEYAEQYHAEQQITKRVFNFDYIGNPYRNEVGRRVASVNTATIEAWDEEHATLLFKEAYPDRSFDPPY